MLLDNVSDNVTSAPGSTAKTASRCLEAQLQQMEADLDCFDADLHYKE